MVTVRDMEAVAGASFCLLSSSLSEVSYKFLSIESANEELRSERDIDLDLFDADDIVWVRRALNKIYTVAARPAICDKTGMSLLVGSLSAGE